MRIDKITQSALLAGAVVAPSVVAAATSAPAVAPKEQRPNIILIMTDQQTASAMSCAGNTDLRTPAMDALAEDGVRLERAYCPFPLSGPCRASLMTGLMPTEIGATDNGVEPNEEAMSQSIGYLMRDAGYETMYAGKW
ncbi:MAG: sulfatase-like hydrolase/transferase, partial [Tidjanibacter sp.]|nr:sulfatase-like hydrolase/transferase [Tidjanibacter sp.]